MWLAWDDERVEAVVREVGGRLQVLVDGQPFEPEVTPLGGGRYLLRRGDEVEVFHCAREGNVLHLQWRGEVYRLVDEGERRRAGVRHGHGGLEAPMPGRVIKLSVEAGQPVQKGQEILVIEAMKMENALRAPHAGRVASIGTQVGEMVAPGRVLVELEAEEPAR